MIQQQASTLKYLSFFLCILICYSCSNSYDNTEELMKHYEEKGRREIGAPFSGVVLIAKNDQVIFEKAYGLSNRELNRPNTVNTRFPIGSITKQFTAMLVMQKVEKGDLDLSDNIGIHLPYLTSKWSKEVTIHQLLSHTSGLPHYEGLFEKVVDQSVFVAEDYSPKELALLVDKVELSYPSNTKFHYSSLGYMLLGAMLEAISGESYSELLTQNIVQPLGLKNTGFASNEFIDKETAKGYNYVEDESFSMLFKKYEGDFKNVPFRDQSNKYSTGGMHSTVQDLFIWSQAIKQNSLLSEKYSDLMLTPNKEGYCYGWFRNWDELIERNKTLKMYTHGGTLFGHNSSINLFDDGTTIIYLANTNHLKTQELTHQLYLSTHHLKDTFNIKGYPNRSSLDQFKQEGGLTALRRYFDELSALCDYKVLPSENSIVHLMQLYYGNGDVLTGDSIKQAFFTHYEPTASTVNRLGYDLLETNCTIALTVFKENTVRFPASPNVWDSYAEGLMNCGDRKVAIENYKMAVKLAETQNHPNLEVFKQNHLKAVQQRDQ